jgi:hypothetical protein
MDVNRLVKWIVIIAIVVAAWKYGIPWAKHQMQGHAISGIATDSSCVAAAQRASEAWGSGLHNFANPPYDLGAWSGFRDDVEKKIAAANMQCSASSQSSDAARSAMSDLKNLIAELDAAITNGSPVPDDAVQRQEAIDTKIEAAAELARSGK